ncbi:serine hydrolase domain-containing protein [Paludisphaera mucosa]|uniref:Serine hydrolase n=1 Tax=Paludisphaera mucosa TaxID=3030827 RepID=A0ABT6F869_9BACT|nr:serine hydrolase domain-containing protein [Paludisphaera mucosa]MDG3003583.1 serine hydrolase [Paludisphaera mucosa]
MVRPLLAAAVLILSFSWASNADAQQAVPLVIDDPAKVGVSAERLPRVSEVVRLRIEAREIAGAVTLVSRHGKVVHYEAQGVLDVDSKRPMTPDALFHMASTTKPVTAAAVVMLIEEGKVRLTDPASKFIPEFQNPKVAVERDGRIELVPARREVQVLDLLTHTSGLLSGGLGQKQAPGDATSPHRGDALGDYVKRIATIPLDFEPGTRWSYSPFGGIDTLARIVEVASGKSFDVFLRERLFEPLGMHDTFFHTPADKESRLAAYHSRKGEELKKGDYSFSFVEPYNSGAAGLVSTAADFHQFGQMLANGGELNGKWLLSPRGVAILSSNHVGEKFPGNLGRPEGMGFGFAVEVVVDPIKAATFRSVGSFGWDGAWGTQIWVDPREGIVAVFMVQATGVRAIQNDFGTAVMQAIKDLDSPR